MKTIFKLILALLLAIFLTGCGATSMFDKSTVTETVYDDGTVETVTTNVDNSASAGDQKAYIAHSQAEAKRISDQTEDIMKNTCKGCTGGEKAWADAFKIVVLGYGDNFKPAVYTLEKSKTGMDVLDTAVGGVLGVAKTGIYVGGGVALADKLLDGIGSNTTITQGDGGTVEESFNTEENKTTASTLYGDANAQSDNSDKLSSQKSSSEEEDEDTIDEDDPLYCTGDSQCEEGFVCDESISTCVKKDY